MASPSTQRTFLKDLQQLCKRIDTSTGNQASIVGIDAMTLQVSLRPKSGYNAHAEFLVTIECCTTYPTTCPSVSFDTPIFHPNIDPSSGFVCLSILCEWRSCYSLLDLVKALLYLIDHPTFHLPLYALRGLDDPAHLAKNSARLLAGLPVNGRRFPPNRAWVEWARVNGCLPSEEDDELEGTEVGASINEEFGQEGDESVSAVESEDEECTVSTLYAPSDTASDSVPSFAKIRYLLDPDEGNESCSLYHKHWSPFELKTQRILIWPPSNDNESGTFAVFYFVEFLGDRNERSDLGQNYGSLFVGSVLHACQSHPESRQTSSICPWYAFDRLSVDPLHSYSGDDSLMDLSNVFADEEMALYGLTADFCPWSAFDDKGTSDLFNGLFMEGSQSRSTRTSVMHGDNESESGSQDPERFFHSCSSSHEEVVGRPDESPMLEDEDALFNQLTRSLLDRGILVGAKREKYVNVTDDMGQRPPSSASSTTYRDTSGRGVRIRDLVLLPFGNRRRIKLIDAGLSPLWKWIFRQSRWPFRLAPQQNVEISMTGIQISQWRAGSGRMLSDVCRFCAKNPDTSNLVLLDPMALSPLSPLLNLMRREASPRPRLTGVLWMTPLDALSPFYRVPVPLTQHQKHCDDEEHEGGEDVYPTPTSLRFLAITAFLTNWVAWLSRMESYTVLGLSRFRPMLVSAPVAAHVLQPCSLGCGQAPLLDLWPLWLLRRLLTLSLRLSQLRVPFLRCSNQHLWWLFPFSDLDEI